MLGILANRTYRHLFLGQVVSLIGTGLATVALGLLAYDLAGADGGAVLGTALAIKMVAYVLVAPLAGAIAERAPRRRLLVLLNLARAGLAALLPFVTEIWQIYLLIFLLQSASGAFTPVFQATIPDVLPEERDYTRALSLSRLAYDLENLLSPALAALLLIVLSYNDLFFGTAIGLFLAAALIVSITLPSPAKQEQLGFVERVTRGSRIYWATPRLRGLFAISLAISAAGAMVIVNTVVLVQGAFGLGAGRVRRRLDDRRADAARLARQAIRSAGDAYRQRLSAGGAGRRGDGPFLCRAACALVPVGDRLCRRANALGKAAAPLGACRGPPGDLRHAFRLFAWCLAYQLSACRMGRGADRAGRGRAAARRARRRIGSGRLAALAGGIRRQTPARPWRSAARSSALERRANKRDRTQPRRHRRSAAPALAA